MNEQLIVKNFGPIKDATVDFKRVTVFIGPTGGGKSTLAKLAAAFLGGKVKISNKMVSIDEELNRLNIINYKLPDSFVQWQKSTGNNFVIDRPLVFPKKSEIVNEDELTEELIDSLVNRLVKQSKLGKMAADTFRDAIINQITGHHFNLRNDNSSEISSITYIPTERVFIPAIEYSWAGLIRDDIGLPKLLLDFANDFSLSRKNIPELEIPFLRVSYIHQNSQDFIKIPEREILFQLHETASGIQSVTPMLVLLEHLSRNTEQAQSFIIEEPELNLYPTAQQGLLNWLVEKCTKAKTT